MANRHFHKNGMLRSVESKTNDGLSRRPVRLTRLAVQLLGAAQPEGESEWLADFSDLFWH